MIYDLFDLFNVVDTPAVFNGPSQQKVTDYVVVYEFEAEGEGELSLKEGEIVGVSCFILIITGFELC